MRDDVKNLLAAIEGDDSAACENASIDLMYKMEESTKHLFKNDGIGDEYLSQDEQIELIDALLEIAESLRPEDAGLLFLVSKASPAIMIEPVQNFLLRHANIIEGNMLRQSLVALQNCMVFKDDSDFEAIKEKFKYEQLRAKLLEIKTQDHRLDDGMLGLHEILEVTLSIMEVFYNQ